MYVSSFKPSHITRQETTSWNMRIPNVPPPYSGPLSDRVETVAQKEMASSKSRPGPQRAFGKHKMERHLPLRREPPTGLPMTSSYRSSGLQAPPILRKNSCDSVQPFHTSRQVETASSKVWSMSIPLPYQDAPEAQTEKNLPFLRDPSSRPPMPSSYLSSGRQAPPQRLRKDSYDSAKPLHTKSQVAIPSISLPCQDALGAQEFQSDSLSLHPKTSTARADPSRFSREDASDDEEDLARRVVDFVLSDDTPSKCETSGAKTGEDTPPKHKTKRTPPPTPQMTPYISSGVRAPPRIKREDSSDDDEGVIQTVWHIHPKREGDEALGPSQIFPEGERFSDGRVIPRDGRKELSSRKE